MNRYAGAAFAVTVLIASPIPRLCADAGPFDGKNFKGRIAYSADGNHNDEDDWAASPVALAILAEAGVKDRVVHFDYNSILPLTDPEWEKIHATSVLGAAERYGYARSIFHDSQRDRAGAVESIRRAIDESTEDNPLYFIVAGPMEVAYLGIQKSKPDKKKFVYVISHSRWNDGFSPKYKFTHSKRSVIPSGIRWVQIADQNRLLSTSPYGRPAQEEEWSPWRWMRDSGNARVQFLWERMRLTKRADCSDAGMAYFLVTGDEEGDPAKLRRLLEEHIVPQPVSARKSVRIEAENFLALENYEVEFRDDRQVSHRINVKLDRVGKGRIRTRFHEPFAGAGGQYDVEVRYLDEKAGRSRFSLFINGILQGEPWEASSEDDAWKIHTIPGVRVRASDEIIVEVQGDSSEQGKLDYVQLNARSGTAF